MVVRVDSHWVGKQKRNFTGTMYLPLSALKPSKMYLISLVQRTTMESEKTTIEDEKKNDRG